MPSKTMNTATLHINLLTWYQKNGRHELPWRHTDDAYLIYLSEIMLQQTQVGTVLERFYFPFLKRFPTLSSIANAPLDDVLKMWQGLGYYTRAKNLHASARICNGTLPDTQEALDALPGIGKSTSHAILAFGFHQPYPVLEANVKRIIARVYALKDPKDKELWQKAWELLDYDHPYDYNQAMMDIGAMVCTPKTPTCKVCPFNFTCKGQKTPEHYPQPKKKKVIPHKKKVALLIQKEGRLGLIQRKERFLHGLWGFMQRDEKPKEGLLLGNASHTYSHFKLSVSLFTCKEAVNVDGWFSLKEMNQLALSKVDEKLLKIVLNSGLSYTED